MTIINLLGSERVGVIPRLSPTVPYAEKHSNAISMSFFSGSKDDTQTTAIPIMMNESRITAEALLSEDSAICLRYTSTCSFPFTRLKILRMLIANVLVLIPPPVDAGDAPIHIRSMMNNMVDI